jgi:uncharacterized membrane protein
MQEKETSRLEVFSDGVFAIAITLLILELVQVLHPHNNEGLLNLLLGHWQSLLAFAIGFLTILVCWINHHIVFTYIKKTDSMLMWVNGFVLLVVTFTPFPTAILAEYFGKETHTALAFFGFNYFMMSLASYILCAYCYKKRLIEEDGSELFYYLKLIYLYSIIYTFLIFFVCFIFLPAAIFFYCVLFIVFAFPKEFASRIMSISSKRKTKKKSNQELARKKHPALKKV